MSPVPPVITRLPFSSFTEWMVFWPIRLWVPTARLLRKILIPAPLSMARMVSTIDELPIGAEPAATCWAERVLLPELMKSKSRPSSLKKPFLSATMAGQMVTLTLITTADSGSPASAGCGAAKPPISVAKTANLTSVFRIGCTPVCKRDDLSPFQYSCHAL